MQTRILVAVALASASPLLYAYQIVEGRYRVETAPGVFEDQLVVRCDDGRTLTVPWETRLAEACGEGLMGERTGRTARMQTPPPAEAAAAISEDAEGPAAAPASAQPATLFDESAQREAMLAQIRAQFGDIPERYIEFKPGPDGLSMRLLPPLNEIVKKYEACRRARQPGVQCAAMRDQAVAKLQEAPATSAAAAPPAPAVPRAKPAKSGSAGKATAATGDTAETAAVTASAAPASGNSAAASAPQQAAAADPRTDPPSSTPAPGALDRAGMEQKIAEDHALCMRLKPKFECEQARSRALGRLDRPKPVKPARVAPKQAKGTPGPEAAAPASTPASQLAAAPEQ
jgi:hypothetical protein